MVASLQITCPRLFHGRFRTLSPMMKKINIGMLAFLLLYSCGNPGQSTTPPGYRLIADWPRLPPGYNLGNPSGIAIDSAQHIVVFHRASKKWPVLLPFSEDLIPENTILTLDRNTGRIISEWGAGRFIMPHSLTIDKDNNYWITDVGLQQVLKFDAKGNLLMTIGEAKVAGTDTHHFNRPTDVAVAPDGSFYVSDGYRNSRVVKFSPAGACLLSWGVKGDGAGQFDLPHSIDLDDNGNVYVADRENSRIELFDPNGRFIKEWKDPSFGKLYTIRFDKKHKHLICSDYVTNYITPKGSDILIFDTTGKLLTRFGRSGNYNGPVCRYHDLIIDSDGNIYTGDILSNRLQKFQPVP